MTNFIAIKKHDLLVTCMIIHREQKREGGRKKEGRGQSGMRKRM